MLAANIPALSWRLLVVRVGPHEVGSFPYALTLGLTRVTLALRRRIVPNDSFSLILCASSLLVIVVHHNPPTTSSRSIGVTVFTPGEALFTHTAAYLRTRLERARMGPDEMSYTAYPDHNEEPAQGGYVGG